MKRNSQLSASEFKKHFLTLVGEVKNKHTSFTTTKRGTPVVRVVHLENVQTKNQEAFWLYEGNSKN
jgi:prevent-host-death family protein